MKRKKYNILDPRLFNLAEKQTGVPKCGWTKLLSNGAFECKICNKALDAYDNKLFEEHVRFHILQFVKEKV